MRVDGVSDFRQERDERMLRAVKGLIALGLVGLAVLSLVLMWRAWPAPRSCSDDVRSSVGEPRLLAAFGTKRAVLLRSQTVDLASGTPAEEGSQTLSVRLASDLAAANGDAQLPSSQVTVGATRITSEKVTVSVSVDPGQPEDVPAACYTGVILVDSNNEQTELPIIVDIGSREGLRALGAFILLSAGAGLGLTIKWITESLTPLAFQRRRLDRLKRALRLQDLPDEVLPVDAQVNLDDAEDRVQRNDVIGLDGLLQPLEKDRASLIVASAAIGRFRRRMEEHEDLAAERRFGRRLRSEARRQITRLTGVELDRIERIRQIKWPEKLDELDVAIEAYKQDSQVIDDVVEAIVKGFHPAVVAEAVQAVQQGDFDRAREALQRPAPDRPLPSEAVASTPPSYDEDEPSAVAVAPFPLLFARRNVLMNWMLGHARTFAALASVLVVALVGLQIEYLRPVEFDDSLGDWLTLFLWALTVELSGVAVLDVVSRLGNAGGSQARGAAPGG